MWLTFKQILKIFTWSFNSIINKMLLSFWKIESLNVKEVYNYIWALKKIFRLVLKKLITNSIVVDIQSLLENWNVGFRKVLEGSLKNAITLKFINTQSKNTISVIEKIKDLFILLRKIKAVFQRLKKCLNHLVTINLSMLFCSTFWKSLTSV